MSWVMRRPDISTSGKKSLMSVTGTKFSGPPEVAYRNRMSACLVNEFGLRVDTGGRSAFSFCESLRGERMRLVASRREINSNPVIPMSLYPFLDWDGVNANNY